MSNESERSPQKPVPFYRKSIKVDFKALSKASLKLGINLLPKGQELAENGLEVLESLGLETKSAEIAWWLVYRSLLAALQELIKERTELDFEKFDQKALQNEINQALSNSHLVIDQAFFEHPEKAAILSAIKPPFVAALTQAGLNSAQAQAVANRLPTYFALALHSEWSRRPQDYQVLTEALKTPFTAAYQREQEWLRYASWLQQEVDKPLFAESFSLKQVFVPLRAYYRRKVQNQEQRFSRYSENERYEQVVVDLTAELQTWLAKGKKDDAIRLISGGPGSGKSSFTKMFAAMLAERDLMRVLFVPLHHFDLTDDLIDALDNFIQVDSLLRHNPLEGEHRPERLLIIFDGLDELTMQGKVAEKVAQDFVSEVQRKVQRINQQKLYLQVLISGRELIIQANETTFRKDGQILHILPYFVPDEQRENYVDKQVRLREDQRQLWWQKYGKVSGISTGLPPELDQNNLIEITAQPLLNYLVALSLRCGKLKFSEDINLNAIYDILLRDVYKRDWAGYQHVSIKHIEEEHFLRILEEIALAAWHGNGRTTTVKEIEAHCNNSGLKSLFNRFQQSLQEDSQVSITRLLIAFYFRRYSYDNAGQQTFEFTHKSFGEYLTAIRIVREVRLIHKKLKAREEDPDDGWDEKEALKRWAMLCGMTGMDNYLFQFVLDEVRLYDQNNAVEVEDWQKTLCHLIGFMLKQGMPMELLNPRPDFQEENRQARNAEEALLVVLNACARVTQQVSEITWPSPTSFGTWLNYLKDQKISYDTKVFCLYFLSYLDLQDSVLVIKDFVQANLKRVNLDGANLDGANLYGANLVETILSGAILLEANLERANLYGAILLEANLGGANLYGTHLERANLVEAYLEGASLKGAYLAGANLVEANLAGANLEGANLAGANLLGANLAGANLTRANLTNTILDPNTQTAEE